MSVQASHILVKHEGSRNPTSWKDSKGEKIRVRTREQAHTTLQGFINDITSGKKTFSEIATTESDCGSAKAGGDLGVFGRGEMQEEFENCAFGLNVGEMSGIIDTASGSHIVLRTR